MKEKVNFLRYNPDLYIPPVIKNFGEPYTHSGKVHQTALGFINEYLVPLFNQSEICLPNASMVELRVSFINSLEFKIETNPELPGLFRCSMFKELSLFQSALEHILQIARFYGFNAERKTGYWSFVKYWGKEAEEQRILSEINSYKEQNLENIIEKAKTSKKTSEQEIIKEISSYSQKNLDYIISQAKKKIYS